MKKTLTHIILLLTAAIMASCTQEKNYRIGVSQCSDDDWRSKMNDEINMEIMFHEDAEVEIRSADDDSRKQIDDIRYFADNGFDIIIVAPNEAAALTPVIKAVYEGGMPVIIFDRNIDGDSFTARIGVDDRGLGFSAAQYALHDLGKDARAIELYGLPGSTPAIGRHSGFSEEFIRGGGRLLASVPANWKKEDAVPVTDSLLALYPETNLIFAHNDRMAIGASEVARRLGRDDIRIIGIDAAPQIGLKAVADSIIDATFLYPTEGYRLIQTALDILKGRPFERERIIPASSAVDGSNADILLLQNETLQEEMEKMGLLKKSIDAYWEKHSSQTLLLYAAVVILVLLFGVLFLILRTFWQHKRHQAALLEQNRLLEAERDKQRELNMQLEEATQSKLMFFTNVSHDLRTPLTLIAEPVAQLAGAPNLTESQKILAGIANKNVLILQRLINQILDFRKYENGKLELNRSEIDFHKTVADWMGSFNAVARKRNIRLSLEPSEARQEVSVAVDVEKLQRVFFNLLSNAFKYTPDNGSITVEYFADDKVLTFKVTDTGIGISARDIGNIFDRFYQVDQVHPKGSGIGLSVTKAFIELHGGTITVDSVLNKGSVFTVSLPVVHVASKTEDATLPISEASVDAELATMDQELEFADDKPLLLVIDDNEDIRALVTELMSSEYNIIRASNGTEGLKKAVRFVPDMIICDVMMPGMDGLECCRKLKEELTTSHIPVVMLTACSMDEQRVQGYESGADGYLSKPFSGEVLKARCKALIDNRKRILEVLGSNERPVSKGKPLKDSGSQSAKLPKSDIDDEFYNRFLEIFGKEMGNAETTVDSIAGMMGLERSQFYRKIKALTNYSPVELMRMLRLKKARTLLLQSSKSISEIAYEVGFSTPAYFTKCYREAYGETPSEVRGILKQ